MNTKRFWEIVDLGLAQGPAGSDEQADAMREKLAEAPADDILAFDVIRQQLLAALCTNTILKVNFIAEGYVSDDVFEDFRHWLMLAGKAVYDVACGQSPDDLADLINVDDPVEDLTGEPLLLLAQEAYEQYGDEDDFGDACQYLDEPEFDAKWPPREELKREFPKLYAKFWTEDREYAPNEG